MTKQCAAKCRCGARCEKYCCHEERSGENGIPEAQAKFHTCKLCFDKCFAITRGVIYSAFKNAGVA